MKSYILNESAFASEVKVSEKNKDVIEFITTLQEADAPNRNGRIYPKRVLEEALKSPYVQERLRTKSFIGEANHPLDTSVQRQMTIDLRNAAFIIKEIWWEGNLVKGRCETCNTAVGRDMKGLIEQGVQVAFSLRANGNVHTDPISGNTIVDSPLNIATYDWIVVPSHSKAFIERICEDTYFSMFRTNDRQDMVALCEAENIFNDGRMLEIEPVQLAETLDYTKKFYKKYKKLSEMYFPEENEEILSMNESEVVLRKDNSYKKVVLEDFLVKDIRKEIQNLTEAPGLRMGILGTQGNNLIFKYTKNSIKIENLVDDYIAYKNIEGAKYRPLLRTAAREDSKCQEIHNEMIEELASGKQNKHRMDSLRNAFFAALDRLYRAEVKADRIEHNTSYIVKEDAAGKGTEKRKIDKGTTAAGIGGLAAGAAGAGAIGAVLNNNVLDPKITVVDSFGDGSYGKKLAQDLAYELEKKGNEVTITHRPYHYDVKTIERSTALTNLTGDAYAFEFTDALVLGGIGLAIAALVFGTVMTIKFIRKNRDKNLIKNLSGKSDKELHGWLELYMKEMRKDPTIMSAVKKLKDINNKKEVRETIESIRPKIKEIKNRVRMHVMDDNEKKLLESFEFLEEQDYFEEQLVEEMNDLELMQWLDENDYEPSIENVLLLKEALSNADIYNKETEPVKTEDVEGIIVENMTDYELMQWLDENGYEPTKENVEILREKLERGE